jgi:hypothetical protein
MVHSMAMEISKVCMVTELKVSIMDIPKSCRIMISSICNKIRYLKAIIKHKIMTYPNQCNSKFPNSPLEALYSQLFNQDPINHLLSPINNHNRISNSNPNLISNKLLSLKIKLCLHSPNSNNSNINNNKSNSILSNSIREVGNSSILTNMDSNRCKCPSISNLTRISQFNFNNQCSTTHSNRCSTNLVIFE